MASNGDDSSSNDAAIGERIAYFAGCKKPKWQTEIIIATTGQSSSKLGATHTRADACSATGVVAEDLIHPESNGKPYQSGRRLEA